MQPDDILKYFNIWTYWLLLFLSRKKEDKNPITQSDFSLMDWYFHTYDNEPWADITDGIMWMIFYLVVIFSWGAVAQFG